MSDRRLKPCATCHHGKSKHRAHGCIQTWQTRDMAFMGISTITKWCPCPGYAPLRTDRAEAETDRRQGDQP